jgi:hypothetical protein
VGGDGTATTITVALEGSISGNVFASIGATSVTTDAVFFVNSSLVEMVRANLTTLASGAMATTTLTANGNTPASGATLSIDGVVYKFQTASLATEGFVLIGANYASAMDNLISAINYAGTPMTDYNGTEAHSSVSATAATASQAIITALDYGVAGNDIIVSGNGATLVFSAGTLLLGADRVEVTVNYTPYSDI